MCDRQIDPIPDPAWIPTGQIGKDADGAVKLKPPHQPHPAVFQIDRLRICERRQAASSCSMEMSDCRACSRSRMPGSKSKRRPSKIDKPNAGEFCSCWRHYTIKPPWLVVGEDV